VCVCVCSFLLVVYRANFESLFMLMILLAFTPD